MTFSKMSNTITKSPSTDTSTSFSKLWRRLYHFLTGVFRNKQSVDVPKNQEIQSTPSPSVNTNSKLPFGLSKSPLGNLAEGTPANSKILHYTIQAQLQTEWCWAANTASASVFYDPKSTWTQCKLANFELSMKDCCNTPTPSSCNLPWNTGTALQTVKIYKSTLSGKPELSQLMQAIDETQVPIVSIAWFGGGGHAVSIYGYDKSKQLLNVANPWGGSSYDVVNFETFPSHYSYGGKWNRTYWTQS